MVPEAIDTPVQMCLDYNNTELLLSRLVFHRNNTPFHGMDEFKHFQCFMRMTTIGEIFIFDISVIQNSIFYNIDLFFNIQTMSLIIRALTTIRCHHSRLQGQKYGRRHYFAYFITSHQICILVHATICEK